MCVCVWHTHSQTHGSCPLPSSSMPLATFCIQVYPYLNRHPAAYFPHQIIQITQMCRCILGLQREHSSGKLWKASFSKKYFHVHTFSVTERCSVIVKATQGTSAVHKLLFKLSICHPELLSLLDAAHALPPLRLPPWHTYARADADRRTAVHTDTLKHTPAQEQKQTPEYLLHIKVCCTFFPTYLQPLM